MLNFLPFNIFVPSKAHRGKHAYGLKTYFLKLPLISRANFKTLKNWNVKLWVIRTVQGDLEKLCSCYQPAVTKLNLIKETDIRHIILK